MRRYERASTLITSHRPVKDRGKLFGDTAAVTALLDRLLHHGTGLDVQPAQPAHPAPSRTRRSASVTKSMTRRAPPHSGTISEVEARLGGIPRRRHLLSPEHALQLTRLSARLSGRFCSVHVWSLR